jgi:glycosyltransferase involved in cell wall biosynthesis
VKIALVTGPCPPGECGVGDYTTCLADALKGIGLDAQVIQAGDWRLFAALRIFDSLRDSDLVHIQYPTLGFGYKLGPHALSLLRRCLVTVHEASQRRILRKLSLLPFLVRPRHVIFTSDFERRFVTRRAPWVAPNSSVIPVASNIRAFPQERQRALNEIVYFGLILPRKGLEQVVELARLIKSGGLALNVRIIGKPRREHMQYFQRLRSDTADLPVIWDLDLSEEEVAERLASSAVAYFPFPDGASERRTSLKAALANGVVVITTMGSQTPEIMKGCLRFARSPHEALVAAHSLLESPQERTKLSRNAAEHLRQCTWEHLAELHLKLYRTQLGSERNSVRIRTEDVKGAQEKP